MISKVSTKYNISVLKKEIESLPKEGAIGPSQPDENGKKVGYKSVIDLGRKAAVYFPHTVADYPTKILPQVMGEFAERLSGEGETVVDPFAGGGTIAAECARRKRRSVNMDVNPYALEVAEKKLNVLSGTLFQDSSFVDKQTLILDDARALPLRNEIADAVVTDIPYADMIKYSDLANDLSNIKNYEDFLMELSGAFGKIHRILKPGRYSAIFVADYRIARSRVILPIHTDVINIMCEKGFELFDLYVWRYYRSGGFRPFGARPFRAMNIHSYILVFHKSSPREIVKNRPVRYRPKLKQKLRNNTRN